MLHLRHRFSIPRTQAKPLRRGRNHTAQMVFVLLSDAVHSASQIKRYAHMQVDGMDVLTVREAVRFARDWCSSGKGPIILEAETYRYHGHSMSDPGTSYRTREEVQAMRRLRDPITLFQKRITESQLATDEEIKDLEKKLRKEVDEDAERCLADASPEPIDGFCSPLLKTPPSFRIRGCDILTWYTPK
ncbi:unnamed protein product [Dicrocoelium dendriticum]|nr:unnamed protein product [Dicrocoelium dendriticum]